MNKMLKRWQVLSRIQKGWASFWAALGIFLLSYAAVIFWAEWNGGYIVLPLDGFAPGKWRFFGLAVLMLFLAGSFWFAAHVATKWQYFLATIWWKLSVLSPLMLALWRHTGGGQLQIVLLSASLFYYTPFFCFFQLQDSFWQIFGPVFFSMLCAVLVVWTAKRSLKKKQKERRFLAASPIFSPCKKTVRYAPAHAAGKQPGSLPQAAF